MGKVTKELNDMLAISRRDRKIEKHVTGRASTGSLIPEVARYANVSQDVAKRVVNAFLQIVYERLVEHNAVSLRNIGVLSFVKARPRKVAKKQPGTTERIVVVIPPRCRLRFRATEKLRNEAGWFPPDEVKAEVEREKARQIKLEKYLREKRENSG